MQHGEKFISHVAMHKVKKNAPQNTKNEIKYIRKI